MTDQKIEIYQANNSLIEVKLDNTLETLWLTQAQMADIFDVQPQNITMHIANIYKEQELSEASTCKNFLQVQIEGTRKVKRQRKHYSLDMAISVGYRVSSARATQFRIWATSILKQHLEKGYSIDQKRFDANSDELKHAIKLIQKAAQSPELNTDEGRGLVEIIGRYTQTFLWLQRYDEGLLDDPKGQDGGELAEPKHAMASLNELKAQLIERGEATDLFAKPRGDGLASIFGNLDQSVFGEPAYPTIESKAAHLLYFMVKNHPFSDGNKRSGAFLFVDFLHRNGRLFNDNGDTVINDTGLAALTLLVAESDPKQKETLIKLIMNMLSQGK